MLKAKPAGTHWTSVHLYHSSKGQDFLQQDFFPLVEDLIKERIIQQFFFVRYFDDRHHIRFRFKTVPSSNIPPINDLLQQYFSPPTQVTLAPYKPEIPRYGGPEFMPIAEQQFMASSFACLRLMKEENGSWSYSKALTYALQFHIGLAQTFSMTLSETIYFFEAMVHRWIGFTIPNFRQLSANEQTQAIQKSIEQFQQLYDQNPGLSQGVLSFWQSFDEEGIFDISWLDQWLADLHEIHQSYKVHYSQGKIHVDAPFLFAPPSLPYVQEKALLFALSNSFVHMTNNRLGIYNQDESYLAFVIASSLKKLIP